MNLKTRLSKLEKSKRQTTTEADCICFPLDEPPKLVLQAKERQQAGSCARFMANGSATCAVHLSVITPSHAPGPWSWRSAQYLKAMDASFPSDRWPATKIVEPDGTVRFVLKDGTEILRLPPEPYTTTLLRTRWLP